MGLVARYLEENGFSTITLTPVHEFNREIGFPRTAAIEYPFGRLTGEVNDAAGQRSVLLATLNVLEHLNGPGQVSHLPFEWPEDPANVKWHPPEISPIVKLFLDQIRAAAKS